MFKITSLSSDRKNTLTLELTLRGKYVTSIKSEKRLREVLQNSISATKQDALRESLQKKFDNNEILDIMRFFGMIAKTRIIETRGK